MIFGNAICQKQQHLKSEYSRQKSKYIASCTCTACTHTQIQSNNNNQQLMELLINNTHTFASAISLACLFFLHILMRWSVVIPKRLLPMSLKFKRSSIFIVLCGCCCFLLVEHFIHAISVCNWFWRDFWFYNNLV